jgi:hypothetical protein
MDKPVAYWRHPSSVKEGWNEFSETRAFDDDVPLYLALQKKEWVSLTDEEIIDIWAGVSIDYDDEINIVELGKAIEAKLKEKNGMD